MEILLLLYVVLFLLVPGVLIALPIILILKLIKKKPNNKPYNEWKSEWTWDEENQIWVHPRSKKIEHIESKTINNFSNSYQARQLFTKNEWYEHRKLQKIAADKGLVICPKVRLLDIIEPRKGEKKYKTLFYKIQAKHVDFVICDQAMHIKAILELDDNSHNRQDRKNRDEFVDSILSGVGYKVIHTRSVTDATLDCLMDPEHRAELNNT